MLTSCASPELSSRSLEAAAVRTLESLSAEELGLAHVEQLQVPQQMLPVVPASPKKSSERAAWQVSPVSLTQASFIVPEGSNSSLARGSPLLMIDHPAAVCFLSSPSRLACECSSPRSSCWGRPGVWWLDSYCNICHTVVCQTTKCQVLRCSCVSGCTRGMAQEHLTGTTLLSAV